MSMKNDARRDMGPMANLPMSANMDAKVTALTGVRNRHNQEMLDGKYDDADDDYASTPHPRAYYDDGELNTA